MKEMYFELKELLTTLFRQLPFPIGGYDDSLLSIYMAENDNRRMTAIVTNNGYTVVSANGEVFQCSTLQEVKSAFILYFRSNRASVYQSVKALGLDV